jgi:hypothetical protein
VAIAGCRAPGEQRPTADGGQGERGEGTDEHCLPASPGERSATLAASLGHPGPCRCAGRPNVPGTVSRTGRTSSATADRHRPARLPRRRAARWPGSGATGASAGKDGAGRAPAGPAADSETTSGV